MSHTPGPWMLATSNSWRRFVNERHVRVCEPVKQPDGHPDLLVSADDSNLIAAAPDLLAACLLYRTTYDETNRHPTVIEEAKCMDVMSAAIAKATGAV